MKDEEKNETNTRNQKNSIIIVAIINGSALIIIFILGLLFLGRKTATEQKIQAKREIVQSQFFYLKQLELFLEKGKDVLVLIYQKSYYLSGSNEPFAKDTVGVSIIIPKIAYDSLERSNWIKLENEIISAKEKINPEIYDKFNQILNLTIKYPLPRIGCPIESLQISPWATTEIKGRFMALQEDLISRVLTMLALVE